MGHRYWGERDKKAALMMDKGLQHLKKSDNIDVAVLSREINGGKTASAPTKLASVQTKHAPVAAPKAPAQKSATVAQVVQNGKYAVQVGSFSNYKRAKNYALSVKNNLAKKFAVHHIAVEKINSANGTMYRSKVVGLAKRDAAKICANMKRQKKSCFVTADNNSMKLAQK